MKARIKFRKYGTLKFIGHLDVMRFFQKVMRRAEIPIAFTSGYSPHMIMSFASPLGIGLTSDGEYVDIELTKRISGKEAVRRMNAVSADGIEILSFRQIADDRKMTGMAIVAAADYLLIPKTEHRSPDQKQGRENTDFSRIPPEKITAFLAQPDIIVRKQTKRSEAEVDIRPMIYRMEPQKDGIYMQLAAGSAQNLKPELVMSAFCHFAEIEEQQLPFTLHRMEMYANMAPETEKINAGKQRLVTLESLGWEICGGDD